MPKIWFKDFEKLNSKISFAENALQIQIVGEGFFQTPTIFHHAQSMNPACLLTANNVASHAIGKKSKVTLSFLPSLFLKSRLRESRYDALSDLLPRNAIALHIAFENNPIKHDIYLFRYCPEGYVATLIGKIREMPGKDRKGMFIGRWGDFVVMEGNPIYPPYWLPPDQAELPCEGMAIDALDIIFANLEVIEFDSSCVEIDGRGRMFAIKYWLAKGNASLPNYLAMDREAIATPPCSDRYWASVLTVGEMSERCQYKSTDKSPANVSHAFRFQAGVAMRNDLLAVLERHLQLTPENKVALLILSGGGGASLRSNLIYAERGESLRYNVAIRQPCVLAYLSAAELARAEILAKSGRIALKRHDQCWLITLPQYWVRSEMKLPTDEPNSDTPPNVMERHLPNGKVEPLSK